MRIEAVDVKGFGTLIHRDFSPFSPKVTLLTGKNEAGKTTFMEFVRRMLFGFPTGRAASKEYDPVTGIVKGGSVTVSLSDATRFQITRIKTQNRSAENYLLFDDTTAKSIDLFPDFIGHVNRDFYYRVFALSHRDLCTGGTLINDSSVKSHLISGLLAVRKYNPQNIMKACSRRAAELFVLRGSVPPVNKLHSAFQQVAGKLRTIESQTDEYLRNQDECERLLRLKQEAQDDEYQLQKQLIHANMLQKAREPWIHIIRQEEIRAGIDLPPSFTNDNNREIEQIRQDIQGIEKRIQEDEADLREQQEHRAAVNPEQSILSHESVINRVERFSNRYYDNLSRRLQVLAKIEQKRKELTNALEELGPAYTPDLIQSLSLTSETRNTIMTAQVTLQNHRSDQVKLREEIRTLALEITRMEQDLPVINPAIIDAEKDVRDLEIQARHIGESVHGLDTIREEMRKSEREYRAVRAAVESAGAAVSDTYLESYDYQNVLHSVREFEHDIHKIEENHQRFSERAEQKQDRYHECLDTRQDIQTELDSIGQVYSVEKLTSFLHSLHELKNLLLLRNSHTKAGEGGLPGTEFFLSAGLIIGGLVCLGTGIALGQGIMLIPGLILCLAGGYSYIRIRSDIRRKNAELEKISFDIDRIAAKLKISSPNPDLISKKIRKTEELIRASERAQLLAISLEKAEQKTREAKGCHELALQDIQKNASDQEYTLNAWREWAHQNLCFPSEVSIPSPSEIYPVLDSLREVTQSFFNVKTLQQRFSEEEKTINDTMHSCISRLHALNPVFGDISEISEPLLLQGEISSLLERISSEKQAREVAQNINNGVDKRKKERQLLIERETRLQDEIAGDTTGLQNALITCGFPSDINPSRIENIMQEVRSTRELIGLITEYETECTILDKQISDYENEIFSLQDLPGVSCDNPTVDYLSGTIISLLKTEKEKAAVQEGVEEKIRTLTARIEQKKEKLADYSQKFTDILAQIGVPDYPSYSRYCEKLTEIRKIDQDIAGEKELIITISGDPDGYDTICEELASTSQDEIEARISAHTTRLQDFRDQISTIDTRIGELHTIIRNLEQSEEHSKLLSEKSLIQNSICEKAEEWAVQTLAAEILQQALSRFEKERQPAVVQRAKRYYHQMTGGAYVGLIIPMAGDDFQVEMASGMIKGPDILSQGTAEQLYTSLRLAYIEEYCAGHEPLPVILDDILINCDPLRRDEAIRAIGAVAESTQVIYCTCHEEVADRFRDILGDVGIISLDNPVLQDPVEESPLFQGGSENGRFQVI